jgi:hypothetical protein
MSRLNAHLAQHISKSKSSEIFPSLATTAGQEEDGNHFT